MVLTNRSPTGLNRGFGGPQLYFALERSHAAWPPVGMDIDHAELVRTQPHCAPRQFPYSTPSGGLYDSGDYETCLDKALELAPITPRLRAERPRARSGDERRRVGVGLAVVVEPSISNMGYVDLAQTAAQQRATRP